MVHTEQNMVQISLRNYPKSQLHSMEKVMTAVIFITVFDSIKSFHRLSTQRVDNLIYGFHGLIIVHYCRWQILLLAVGMRKRHMSRHGVSALYSVISIHNITTAYYSLNIKIWLNRRCLKRLLISRMISLNLSKILL